MLSGEKKIHCYQTFTRGFQVLPRMRLQRIGGGIAWKWQAKDPQNTTQQRDKEQTRLLCRTGRLKNVTKSLVYHATERHIRTYDVICVTLRSRFLTRLSRVVKFEEYGQRRKISLVLCVTWLKLCQGYRQSCVVFGTTRSIDRLISKWLLWH